MLTLAQNHSDDNTHNGNESMIVLAIGYSNSSSKQDKIESAV